VCVVVCLPLDWPRDHRRTAQPQKTGNGPPHFQPARVTSHKEGGCKKEGTSPWWYTLDLFILSPFPSAQ